MGDEESESLLWYPEIGPEKFNVSTIVSDEFFFGISINGNSYFLSAKDAKAMAEAILKQLPTPKEPREGHL